MRRKLFLLAFAALFPILAAAQTAGGLTVFPSQVNVGEPELTLTLTGASLAGELDTKVLFSSTAGSYEVLPIDVSDSAVITPVPSPVTDAGGTWNVYVEAIDSTGTRTIGPATLTVVQPVIQAPPLLSMPEVVVVEATSPAGATVSYTVTGTSFVDPAPVVNCTPPSGSVFGLGGTTVNCTASDSFGSTSGSFTVFVQDSVPPVITVPANMTVQATSASGAVVTFTATATDAIAGAVTPTCSPASGSTFPVGTTTVECVAVDDFANFAYAFFSVKVVTGPQLILPADITAEATSAAGAVVTYTVTTDPPDATVSCSPASGSTFPLGTTTVSCTATNSFGSTSGSFLVTVVDTTPPQILDVKATPDLLWPPNHKMIDVQIAVTALDAVDPNPTNKIVSVTSNQPVDGTGDGDTSPDWVVTGPLTLQLRAERAGGQDRIYSITVTSTDFSGNTSTSTVQVKVPANKSRASR